MIHPDLSQLVKSGCIGMHQDGKIKKENPASIRCLAMLLRCLCDLSTDPLRLMTAALRFTTVELRMLMMPPRFDRTLVTIQAGNPTVASRPPTNLHDLVVMVVVMRQFQGGTLIFSSYVGSGPASTVHPYPPPPL